MSDEPVADVEKSKQGQQAKHRSQPGVRGHQRRFANGFGLTVLVFADVG